MLSRKLVEHILSIVLITGLIGFFVWQLQDQQQKQVQENARELQPYLQIEGIDWNDPLHRAFFRETLAINQPQTDPEQLLAAIDQLREEAAQKTGRAIRISQSGQLNGTKITQLIAMYLQFILAYILVLILTYYGVQTLGTLRFVQHQTGRTSYLRLIGQYIRQREWPSVIQQRMKYIGKITLMFLSAIGRGVLYFLLFSPAYVIAYSFKTRFDTDSLFFMVLLGVLSNGLLITYANKFYTFLINESRRGYVQTARVKGLNNNYRAGHYDGVRYRSIFAFRKKFPGHVFQHIFSNARFQYVATFKEQASFLISGLVIIEMALNIQNHLCYELLQSLLFRQFAIALLIVLGIFLVLKATEILVDIWLYLQERHYDNREAA